MGLKDILMKKRSDILGAWFNMVMDTYPPDAAAFYKTERDRFLNPIGYIVNEGLSLIYDGLIGGSETEDFTYNLERIIRVMAVQDCPPSRAISFVFLLKKILKEVIRGDNAKAISIEELDGLYDRIDGIALFSFDLYMGCREDINRIRMDEIRQQKEWAIKNLDILERRKGQ